MSAGSAIRLERGPLPGEASQFGASLATGGMVSVTDRRAMSSTATTSQQIWLSHFRAPRSFTAATCRVGNGTAASATPTLCRVGLYRQAANGDLTLIASTANDTALFNTLNSAYVKSFSVAAAVVGGEWLAAGILIVSAAGMPSVMGPLASNVSNLALSTGPRLSSSVSGQPDLPGSIAVGSLSALNAPPWVEINP